MKKTILILILFYITTINCQNGIIIYKTKSINLNTDKNKTKAKAIKTEIDLMKFKLFFDSEKSYFKSEKNIPINPLMQKLATVVIGSTFNSYQYNKSKLSLINIKIFDTIYKVNFSEKNMKNWKLFNETKIIDGFECYKAEKTININRTGGKRKYTAWYTTNIALPYGPSGMGGLPGLILELQIGNRAIYIVDKILLNPKINIKVEKIKDGKTITVKEMVDLRRKERKYTKD
ncbi:GLPGLI family protein [Polaribacter sp. BM10]|uniref:GLPGLI family protein n=1 Tax=Polaribacter sp. BM10 TaxID=1529069 RepID=UPI00098A7DE0|nr:GLPGLI family protein [Polaribacter sp. BM10]AQS92793.1 hypothetical protein BXQ17_01370 [Polaribacter sp. BM10]